MRRTGKHWTSRNPEGTAAAENRGDSDIDMKDIDSIIDIAGVSSWMHHFAGDDFSALKILGVARWGYCSLLGFPNPSGAQPLGL